jgi:hypothetical protein
LEARRSALQVVQAPQNFPRLADFHLKKHFRDEKLCTVVLTICTYVVKAVHDIGSAWTTRPVPLPEIEPTI